MPLPVLSTLKRLLLCATPALLLALFPSSLRLPPSMPLHADGICAVDVGHLTLDSEEQAVLSAANAYRAVHGVPALYLSTALLRSALWKSTDMASRGALVHDDAFRSWLQRLNDCGYSIPGAWMAENLASGAPTGMATLQLWERSPPHNENLLDPAYIAVGIKRVQSPNSLDPSGWYWTMDFGSTIGESQTAEPPQ